MPDSSHSAIVAQARQAIQNGQGPYAVQFLTPLYSEYSSRPEYHELLAMAHAVAGNNASAMSSFRSATRLDPSKASIHYNFAVYLDKIGELDEASEENQTVLLIDPTHEGAQRLQLRMRTRLQERDYVSEQGFEAVGKGADPREQAGRWSTLVCPTCGHKNFMTARVCKKCQQFIPEMDEIIPVE